MTKKEIKSAFQTLAQAYSADLMNCECYIKSIIEVFRDANKWKAAYAMRELLGKCQSGVMSRLHLAVLIMTITDNDEDLEEQMIDLWEESVKKNKA